MAVRETELTGAAVFEIERFEWAAPDRIELVGTWSDLRARRFIRPTLLLEGEGESKRLLATLEHKPWQAADGEEWIAAFAWEGDPVKFQAADLNVGAGLDVKLPPPRLRPGKPRRFKHRAVSRDAAREAAAAAAPTMASPGIVTEPLAPAKPDSATKAAAPAKPAPAPAKPKEPAAEAAAPASAASPATAPRTLDEPVTAPVDAPPATDAAAVEDAPAPTSPSTPDRSESLRRELDLVRSARDRAREERDEAFEQVRAVRAEMEAARQAHERAILAARAEERDKANTMLAEGAELRASLERQRAAAYEARDGAFAERDKAVAAREKAETEREQAVQARKQAERDRAAALSERDSANKERDRALSARDKAFEDRDEAIQDRVSATKERDQILSIHERDLPVHPPKPRWVPDEGVSRTQAEIWAPRAAALGVLALFAIIVLRVFVGG